MGGHRPTVVIVGAGPTGITAATLLAQYGVHTLVLDRFMDVYPQPRAVHLDDEVCRILGRLGVASDFARISRPAAGLRLVDPDMKVLAQFTRPASSRNGYPQANMFDQPELERLLRVNLNRYPSATVRVGADVTALTERDRGGVTVTFTDRATGRRHAVDADYLLGCDGANSLVRDHIGASSSVGWWSTWPAAPTSASGTASTSCAIRAGPERSCRSAMCATGGSSGYCPVRQPATSTQCRRCVR